MRAATVILVLFLCATALAQEHKVGVLYYTEPVFPPIARQAQIYGDVVVELKLSEAGFIQSMTILSGHPMLNQATLESLKKWQFICLDCKHYPEPITHRFTMIYKRAEVPFSCERSDRKLVTPDFPNNRMTVEAPSACIESDPDGLSPQEHKVGVNRYVVPKYPPIARQARIQGDVVFDLRLDANGEIAAVASVTGHPMLKSAALESIKKWRFICIDCKPGEAFLHKFTIRFELEPCEDGPERSYIEFPQRLIVRKNSVCVHEIQSSSSS